MAADLCAAAMPPLAASLASLPVLLVTANVGSVFEDPDRLLAAWIDAFVAKVRQAQPAFVALHLQEVGGKTYEKSMEYVQDFIRALCESPAMVRFACIRVYLDEDYTSAEHFTALGNLYFIDPHRVRAARIWNFLTHEWEPVVGKSVHTGNIEAVPTKEKAKFPKHFFPECKWSRKGFLRTRWSLTGTVVDLVNIHLFHDASNLAACDAFPSVYCRSRRRALVHTMERFHTDRPNGLAPYFVFGDFNFRCDTAGVVRRLSDRLVEQRVLNARNDCAKLQFHDAHGTTVLTVGKKEFVHAHHQTAFKEDWFRAFDREMEPLAEVLYEYPITFAPSYPYEEEPTQPGDYMHTRCPAWCDRILLNAGARRLVANALDAPVDAQDAYNVIGDDVCMGDHKPVFLTVALRTEQDLSEEPSVSDELQRIIDEVLVPPYDKCEFTGEIPDGPSAPPLVAQSRYVQVAVRPADQNGTDNGIAIETTTDGAFSYSCSTGMVFRETTV